MPPSGIERAAKLSKNSHERFEPAIRFIRAAKSAHFLAANGTDEQKRDFLKKIGSNLKIEARTVSFVPRGAWAILTKTRVNSGRFAQPDNRAAVTAARLVGESGPNFADFVAMRTTVEAVRTFYSTNPALHIPKLT